MVGASLTLCMLGNFSCFYCRLLTFFKINLFKKLFPLVFMQISGNFPDLSYLGETQKNNFQFLSQTVWIQIRTDIVKTVCKGYRRQLLFLARKELKYPNS